MKRNLLLFISILVLLVPGCTTPETTIQGTDEEQSDVPERLNLIADTAGRDIDRVGTMDILADANGQNTLILWVSTGCSGCHDWTEMISDEMINGNISNDTRIITVHRYPSFESRQEVIDVYASNESSTNSLWPVLIPVEDQPAIDVEKNQETDIDYATAFDTPATPSFTILDGEGYTIWTNKEYWADKSVLNDALNKL